MNTLTRIILSWIAVLFAALLPFLGLFSPGMFGDPTILIPLIAAYVLRYEFRPEIPRDRAPSRRWLSIPIGLFAIFVIIPASTYLLGAMITAIIWAVFDDLSIYRHHIHSRNAHNS
ncbi:MAG TPA: hypothetical protein VGH19_14560 [Verrucomicrobiae bacterium]